MPEITERARFDPSDAIPRILAAMACPACGYLDPADTYRLRPGNGVRFFCDNCGAFVTIVLDAAQADAIRRLSSTVGGVRR